MWINKFFNTLPRAFPPVEPLAHRAALLVGNSAPANQQGSPYCPACEQAKSVHEFYADIAK